ncbi:MAG: radical SAM protein [Candidatus Omnitrophica bacterium]|nr:radical SAM protein [Candidatus Omnitrophota bacterium]
MGQRLKSRLSISGGFRIIDLAITYSCNLHCKHCSASVLESERAPLGLEEYKKITCQAKSFDNLSYNITGGEPLMVEWLDDLIPVLDPARHFISIQTNCMLLSAKRAKQLARLGVNCITTSLDSADEKEHNHFRGSSDSYRKVLEGLDNAIKAGMSVLVGGTVTHQNLRSAELQRLIEKVNSLGAIFLFNIGVPCGEWKDNRDMLFRDDDRDYLLKLMETYPMTSTDHEINRHTVGCPAGKEKVYITSYGDVLPCPFIHVSFGNVRTMPLAEIIARMNKISLFGKYANICVAAEDRDFQKNVLSRVGSVSEPNRAPISYKDVYGEL